MKYVVCDIDGTLTKVGDRLKCLEKTPKDWDSFYARCGEDEPNAPIVALLHSLLDSTTLDIYEIYCTGRRESCRDDTIRWIGEQDLPIDGIFCFRSDGDMREDVEVKPEILAETMRRLGINKEEILFILEDRSSMVKKWRDLGYTCLQVADGDF